MSESEITIAKDESIIGVTKKSKSKEDITIHKDAALRQLNSIMCKYLDDSETMDKTDKLSYWFEDFCRMISFEKDFKPYFLKSYNRGDVIKVNLGYNIGNEEGGLHYCVVLDKNNSKKSGIITVIPLTSDKEKELHFSEVPLGNEIYTNFMEKYNSMQLSCSQHINNISKHQEENNIRTESIDEVIETPDLLKTWLKIKKEINKMKKGSIALVSQITTISKQRIYDPQKTGDILSGLRISDESLDLINEKMKKLFIKN